MKELDSKIVLAEIENQMQETGYDIENILGLSVAKIVVLGIYQTNDLTSGYGQDFRDLGFSVISSRKGISVICGACMSMYKDSLPLCGYDNLSIDIASILNAIQAALDRIDQ